MTLLTPVVGQTFPTAVAASASLIRDAEGKEWIDGSSGAIASIIGHGHPRVIDAVCEQMAAASFLYRTQFTNEPAQRLANRLCEKLGFAAAFFVNSGSEAVEAAVRLAQQYWVEAGYSKKTRILSRKISYHGATSGALSLSGHWPRRRACAPMTTEPTLPTPYCFRCPLGQRPDSCRLACARAVEEEIQRLGADTIAAIVVEPVVGASGAAMVPPRGYLSELRSICDRYDILLIGDEVLTGMGRTGRWLGMDHGGVKADIVCLGKGLNAGYIPISGFLISDAIYSLLAGRSSPFALGHTHSNHPVAAAAANAVLDVLEDDHLVERAATTGSYLGNNLRSAAAEMPFVGDVRGQGMLWGIELVQNDISCAPWPTDFDAANTVVRHAFDLGLIIYPSSGFIHGASGDAVIVAPPLNTTIEVLDTLVERLTAALNSAAGELHQKNKTGVKHGNRAA